MLGLKYGLKSNVAWKQHIFYKYWSAASPHVSTATLIPSRYFAHNKQFTSGDHMGYYGNSFQKSLKLAPTDKDHVHSGTGRFFSPSVNLRVDGDLCIFEPTNLSDVQLQLMENVVLQNTSSWFTITLYAMTSQGGVRFHWPVIWERSPNFPAPLQL